MHKIAKGLKKKKKGKKSKHKEEELFKPEELEAYRKEHSAVATTATDSVGGSSTTVEGTGKNEEWRNFLTLTSGVDDILKKTQDDLDRIKSTSFFQRVPPPSEHQSNKQEQPLETTTLPAKQEETTDNTAKQKFEENQVNEQKNLGIVEISESETDDEDEDDVFDTTYLDALASGNIKLAYIPDSPTDNKQDENDPFDTSIAERAILGPAVDKKGKKLVPIGAAVEVLTGRVQLPTCATKPVNKRQILKEKNLLLESFDSTEVVPVSTKNDSPDKIKTLLDDDEIPLPNEPIDLSKSLYIPPPIIPPISPQNQTKVEFEDEADKEFEALATESLVKSNIKPVVEVQLPTKIGIEELNNSDWKAFDSFKKPEENNSGTELDTEEEVDPFDTTFAGDLLQSNKKDDKHLNSSDIVRELKENHTQLRLIAPVQRDLLGGSTSDLSKLGDQPIQPTNEEELNLNEIKYCDPFDTSLIDSLKAPGQTELKFLEKELLGDINQVITAVPKNNISESFDDNDDFDPRALEDRKSQGRTLSRPDVLNVSTQSKSVSFIVPKTQEDLLGLDDVSKTVKPLTPFYVRKNSIPGLKDSTKQEDEEDLVEADPFDTSFVKSLTPGKAELKVIETELFQSDCTLDDPDFDPRDNSKLEKVTKVEAIKEIINPKKPDILTVQKPSVDLLAEANDIAVKVLTPATDLNIDSFDYDDPFDTSIATNILPGKAELKLLENELNTI